MEGIKTLFKTTKDVIDKVWLGINTRQHSTCIGYRLSPKDCFEDEELFDLTTKENFASKRDSSRRHKRDEQRTRDENVYLPQEYVQLIKSTKSKDDTNNSNVSLNCNNEASVNLDTSELEVSGYTLKVINRSQLDKLDVARGLSESLRELFLSSPEKISNASPKLPFVNTSEVESLNESHGSDTESSGAEYSGTSLNETSGFKIDHDHTTVNPDHRPRSHDGINDASSALSSESESSVYLNNNESWSIYSTSDNESNVLSASEEVTNDSSYISSENSKFKRDEVSEIENAGNRILYSYSIPSSSVTSTTVSTFSRSETTEARKCSSRKQNESSEAYQEFQHDIAFLAQCSNKMSTPDKTSSPSILKRTEDTTSKLYNDIDNDKALPNTQSNITEDHSYYSTDLTTETDTSSSVSTRSSSPSSSSYLSEYFNAETSISLFTDDHFVHGLSPLCKENDKRSCNKPPPSPKYVQPRIVIASKSHWSPTHITTRLPRLSTKVRRRIIFAHNGLRSGVHSSVKIVSEKSGLITRGSEREFSMNGFNTLSPVNCYNGIVDKYGSGNISTNKQSPPKCVFESETEEAVYYLITKYLDNEMCPW
ncbi:hypothetical protein ACF0H5_000741 [Mactra antiquata]